MNDQELIERLVDGSLDESDYERVRELLTESEEARALYRRLAAMDVDISDFAAGIEMESVSQQTKEDAMNNKSDAAALKSTSKTNVEFGTWAIAIAVVACLLLLGLFFLPKPQNDPGIAIPNGGEHETDPQRIFEANEVTRKQLEDGTVVIAHAGSRYKIDKSRQVTLENGDLYLIVAKSDKPFIVKTDAGEVRATGTRFTVQAGKSTTTAVAQGSVTLSNGKGKVKLAAGEQGEVEKGKRPTRGPAPRLSHLVSWAKEALSQDELLVEKAETKDGLIAIDPWGQEVRLTLRKFNIDVYIEDGIARTTIDQTFFNHNPWNTEGTFYFPLPPDASVSRLAMYVAGDLNEGGMVTRERGQDIYNRIRYQNRDPALLEMMQGNVFKMRIFPLEGRQEKRVFLSYTQKLEELYGTMRYWFPMEHTHSIAKQLSIKVHVKDGAGTFETKSSTHKFEKKKDGDDLVLRYNAKQAKPDQDLLLHLLPAKEIEKTRVASCDKDGMKFVFGGFTPKIPGQVEAKPRQWIVLNDISASRSKIEAKAQRYIVERLVKEADDNDSLTIVNLNTKAETVLRKLPLKEVRLGSFVAEESQAGEATYVWPEGRRIGGTNMAAGIEEVGKLIDELKFDNPHILYLGDGVATDGATEVFSLVRAIPRSATFIGVGVGKKVDSLFLQSAADQTGGAFTTINPDDDIDWRVFDMIAALNTPRMTKIKVKLLNDAGKEMVRDTIAYPSSRSLAEGETLTVVARCEKNLPAKIKVEGKVGKNTESFEVSMDEAKIDAEYIPRLWAKRHIDELTKSDMERKDEIISLSKQYYVVTPYTSLIVLEDDKMYAEFNVERGRKDHWALYNAPKKIEVVKEPIDWSKSRWSWYAHQAGEDAKATVKERPQSVQEIVDSVQFRINAPFYFSRPQQTGDSRHMLYQLLDSKSDPTWLLAYWMLMASDDKEAAEVLRSARSPEGMKNSPPQAHSKGQSSAHKELYDLIGRDMQMPVLMDREQLDTSQFNISSSTLSSSGVIAIRQMLSDEGFLANQSSLLPLNETRLLSTIERIPQRESILAIDPAPASMMFKMLSVGKKKRLASPALLETTYQSSGSFHWMQPQLADSFRQALGRRWSVINQDIQRFNQQYGYWNYSGRWNSRRDSLDLTKSSNFYDYGGLEELLEEKAGESMPVNLFIEGNSKKDDEELPPAAIIRGGGRLRSRSHAMAWIGVYTESMKNQPGVTSVLAADHLVRRRTELLEKALNDDGKKELEIVNKAIEGIRSAATRLEDTGPFWGHQGWDYRPQRWTFQAPTVQVYQNYNWSFDLTRYAPALYSNSSDVLNEVVEQYGLPKTIGEIDPKAAKAIEQARRAVQPAKTQFGENGLSVIYASNDRYQVTHQTNMYLEERMVCDGQNVLHLYDELGLAARRPATTMRLAELRHLSPHIVEPAESLARRFDVLLLGENEGGFDLKLTPHALKDSESSDTKRKTEQPSIHLIVSVTNDGKIRGKELYVDDEKQLNLVLQYADEQAVARWFDKDDKEIGKFEFTVVSTELDDSSFETDLSKYVVFNMPLRKPSYYAQKLEKLGDGELAEKIELNRHQALAMIQQFHRRRWGQTNTDARACLTAAYDTFDQIESEPVLGDMTLLLATGRWDAVDVMSKWKDFDDSQPIVRYAKTRTGWQEESDGESTSQLIAHMAAYHAAVQNHQVTPKLEYFKTNYPNSPLLLAATYYAANWGNKPEVWSELYQNPNWRGMAILMSAGHQKNDVQRKEFIEACESWITQLSEAGYDAPITPQIANILRASDSQVWKSLISDRFGFVKESDRIAPLLKFVEDATSWGETDVADEALQLARERLDKQTEKPLLGRFALAQSLWASGRLKEALDEYDAILKKLEQDLVPATPALLASIARLAQQTGDQSRAIEYEERALAAEQEHLPDMINIQAFRGRYNWLWDQYKAKVASAVTEGNDDAINHYMNLAESAWQRWFEIDQNNTHMIQQMATLQMTVKRPDRARLYLTTIIDQKPRDASSCYAMSSWYQGRGELDEAQNWLASAYKWDTANPQWLYQRGQVLNKMGRNDEANALYQKVIDGEWAPGLQGWINQAKNALQ